MAHLPVAFAEQIAVPIGAKLGWAVPLENVGTGKQRCSVSFKDAVSFWEKFQCLGVTARSNGQGVGPLQEAATFEQILANWEFRGRPGTNATVEDVVKYAATRWHKQYTRSRKTQHKKARTIASPYPVSKTLREKMKKSSREKLKRQKVKQNFDALYAVVTPDADSKNKHDKSALLSKAIQLIESLQIENKALEREKQDLSLQCQSISRLISAGFSQMTRHREAANAAAAAAVRRRPSPSLEGKLSRKFPEEHLKSDVPPPPAQIPIPKIQSNSQPTFRHSRRRSDALQQHIMQQWREARNGSHSPDNNFFDIQNDGDIDMGGNQDEKGEQQIVPMENENYKPIFDSVLMSLPRSDNFNDLSRPSRLRDESFIRTSFTP